MKNIKQSSKKKMEVKKTIAKSKDSKKVSSNNIIKILVTRYQEARKLLPNKLQDVFTEYMDNKGSESINILMLNKEVTLQEQISQELQKSILIETVSLNVITKTASFALEYKPNDNLDVVIEQLAQVSAHAEDQFILDALNSTKDTMCPVDTKDGCIASSIAKAIAMLLAIRGNYELTPSTQVSHVVAHVNLLENLRECIQKQNTPYISIFSDLIYGKTDQALGVKFHWISTDWSTSFPTDCIYVFNSNAGARLLGDNNIVINADSSNPNSYTITLTVRGNAKVLSPKDMIVVSNLSG